MSVPFTQYIRPDGRREAVSIDLDLEVETKAKQIIAAGYVFECEVLSNGICSFTITDPKEEVDVAIKLSENGPAVPAAITQLIMGFKL